MSKAARIASAMSAVGALLGTLGAGTSRPGPGVAGVSDHVIAAKRSAILRYWTVQRMQRALTPPERVRRRPAARPPQFPLVSAGAAPLADAAARQTAEHRPGAPWASPGAVRATTGKVFFTINGADFLCSAGTVTGANHDLVVTAGHCVQDAAGLWARNWIYVPGYDQGRRPYGAFTSRRVFVPSAWSGRHDENHDVAIVALATLGGRHVADVVGAQTIAFDQPRGVMIYGFGYPTGGHYDGERLAYCSGTPHPDAHRLTRDQGLRCDMSEGASGGPWLARFDATAGTGVVTSVNSFKYSDDPATMYGPYFGAAVRRIYEEAQRA
ncbi:MAG: trypsin-like serine peptidase [Actinoallomurus sp.]